MASFLFVEFTDQEEWKDEEELKGRQEDTHLWIVEGETWMDAYAKISSDDRKGIANKILNKEVLLFERGADGNEPAHIQVFNGHGILQQVIVPLPVLSEFEFKRLGRLALHLEDVEVDATTFELR